MKICLFATCALFLCYSGFAGNFIVTSNADSGPGTLREAITMANANGTAAMDYINFNIADQSVAGRTIGLLTALPYLTSNITIDGTTQPGIKIGVSDAKIRVTNPTRVTIEQVFAIMNASNVNIYGIHFASLNFDYDPNVGVDYAAGIRLRNATNVAIGALGKGNYFTKQTYAVADLFLPLIGHGFSTDISFKSNIVNLTEDGNAVDDCCTRAISLTNVKNFEIGGDNPQEGNFIDGGYNNATIGVVTDTLGSVNTGFLKLINNHFGCNYSQTVPLISGSVIFTNNNYYSSSDTCQVTVKNNSYNFVPPGMSFDMYAFLGILNKSGFIDIKGNKVMLLNPSNVYFDDIVDAFDISGCENGIIGGPGPNDTNYIVACEGSGINLYNNKNITITKNSLWCNYKGITSASDKVTIPKTKIFTITDYTAAGTVSIPNCTIEVFLNRSPCQNCNNGKTYLGSVSADGQGNWAFTSPVLLDGPVTATATTPDGATGEFAHPEHDGSQIVSSNPTCHENNGYIHGMKFISGTRYYWVHNYLGVSDTTFAEDIDSLPPGQYTFVVEQGKYCSESGYVLLGDASPQINSTYKTLTNPTCGLYNGSVTNVVAYGNFNKVIWQDAGSKTVGNSLDLFNVGEGKYRLIVLDTIHGCSDTSEFFTLTNQSGPTLSIADIKINPSTCESSNGSITGLTASNVNGSPSLQWYDSLNNVVGTSYNLLNVLPGKYRFTFKDNSGCDTIHTPYYTIPDNGLVQIDTTGMVVTPSTCASVSGSIQHIQIIGGTSYQWINTGNNNIIGSSPDVFNFPSGNYQLTVTNAYGCTKKSPIIFIPQAAFGNLAVAATVSNAFCSQNTGSVTISTSGADTSLFAFRWMNSTTGQNIATTASVSGLAPGSYQLFAKDSNGCEKRIYTASIISVPPPVIEYPSSVVMNDHCRLSQGRISLDVSGLAGPTSYTWYDENDNIAGTGPVLKNVPAGSYTVTINDAVVCTIHSDPFLVGNENTALSSPLYNAITVPRYSDAAIKIASPAEGSYALYYNIGGQPVDQNDNGNFMLHDVAQDTTVYIQETKGFCSSQPVAVHIKVVDRSYFAIPNAFTPNGDGHNDVLHVRAIGYITLTDFKIYNQWGQLMFETHRLNDGWDGTLEGTLQNTGIFVWVAEGTDIKGNLVKDKGTFVLLH
jgi:gliding motility-associated-like protein